LKRILVRNRKWIGLTAVALCLGVWGAIWWFGDDASVIVDNPGRRHDPNVENGRAFDRAVLPVGQFKKIALPGTTVVRQTTPGEDVVLRMEKRLSFGGHPPQPMSIRDARYNMGCAVKTEGDTLVVATFGEWDSRIEGGASMKLVAEVPEGVEVVRREELSGPDSRGREWKGPWLTTPAAAKGGYWYGPASPAGGWLAVQAEPDPYAAARVSRGNTWAPSRTETAWYLGWIAVASGAVVTWGIGLVAITRRGRGRAAAVGFGLSLLGALFGVVAWIGWLVTDQGADAPWEGLGLGPAIAVAAAVITVNLLGLIVLPRTATPQRESRGVGRIEAARPDAAGPGGVDEGREPDPTGV
jgi:hypothetical protein